VKEKEREKTSTERYKPRKNTFLIKITNQIQEKLKRQKREDRRRRKR